MWRETLVVPEAYSVHMLQVATPPLPPTPPPGVDLNFLLDQLMPIVGLVVVFVGLRWLFRTPVGEAFAERIRLRARGRWGGGRGGNGRGSAARGGAGGASLAVAGADRRARGAVRFRRAAARRAARAQVGRGTMRARQHIEGHHGNL